MWLPTDVSIDEFDFFQVRPSEACTYYSSGEYFSAMGSDGDSEYGQDNEPVYMNNVRNRDADARPSMKGLSFFLNVILLLCCAC